MVLHEAVNRAGGRAWSFHDARLDRVIDNGNHLVLSGNAEVLAHCDRIGTTPLLDIAPRAELPFLDLARGDRWLLRLPSGLRDLVTGGLRLRPAPLCRWPPTRGACCAPMRAPPSPMPFPAAVPPGSGCGSR